MLWLVIGYMFLFIFRPYEYWSILGTLHVERIYMIVLLAAVLTWKDRRYIAHPINKAVLGFFLVTIVSAVFAFDTSAAFTSVQEYFKLLVFYVVIVLTIRDEKDLKTFLVAYIVIMFLYVGKSAWEFFVHDRFWWRMGIKRMMGIDITYADPNYFAASIAYSLPFWWALFMLGLEKKWQRMLLWAYGGLAAICIIYSGSRSGMVTALLFVFLIWAFSPRKKLGIILIPVLLVVTWTAMPESYKIRFESIFVEGVADEAGQKGADASAQGRLVGLKQGYRTFLSHPVLGIGPGNFKYSWAGGTGEILGGSAHNLYGQLLGEMGGAGFVAFAVFVGTIFLTHWRVRRKAVERVLHFKEQGDLPAVSYHTLLVLFSTASVQALVLLLFNGNFGHNLFRYNYLWIGAIGVLCWYFLDQAKVKTAG